MARHDNSSRVVSGVCTGSPRSCHVDTPEQHPLGSARNLLSSPRHSQTAAGVVQERIKHSKAGRCIGELASGRPWPCPFDVFPRTPVLTRSTLATEWTMSPKQPTSSKSYKKHSSPTPKAAPKTTPTATTRPPTKPAEPFNLATFTPAETTAAPKQHQHTANDRTPTNKPPQPPASTPRARTTPAPDPPTTGGSANRTAASTSKIPAQYRSSRTAPRIPAGLSAVPSKAQQPPQHSTRMRTPHQSSRGRNISSSLRSPIRIPHPPPIVIPQICTPRRHQSHISPLFD